MKGVAAWAGVMGAISLEVVGHLNNVIDTPGALSEAVVELHGQQLISGTSSTLQTSKRV